MKASKQIGALHKVDDIMRKEHEVKNTKESKEINLKKSIKNSIL